MNPNRRFALHYLEMVAAMFVGMGVLGGAFSMFFTVESTAGGLAEMGLTMTAGMALWMTFRCHGVRANAEMAASMLVPTAFVIALHASGTVSGERPLMVLEHVLMLPSMLAVMLIRREEYSGHTSHGKQLVSA